MTGLNGKSDKSALWMPPGSVRGIIAIVMVVITGFLLWLIISSVFVVEDTDNKQVVLSVSGDLLMGVMGLLTTWFTLLGLVLKALFDSGASTDKVAEIGQVLEKTNQSKGGL